MNEILNKSNNKKDCPSYSAINNHFNNFFGNIGPSFTKNLHNKDKNVDIYIKGKNNMYFYHLTSYLNFESVCVEWCFA